MLDYEDFNRRDLLWITCIIRNSHTKVCSFCIAAHPEYVSLTFQITTTRSEVFHVLRIQLYLQKEKFYFTTTH